VFQPRVKVEMLGDVGDIELVTGVSYVWLY